MGNICRSPTGEGVMQALVDKRGLSDQVEIDSAGTIGYHTGHAADTRMQQAARNRGYELTSKARRVTRDDLRNFDLIIAMDRDNYEDLLALDSDPRAEIRMLGSFLPDLAAHHDDLDEIPGVPDPYYGGAAGFETVLDMIEKACEPMLDYLLSQYGRRDGS
jgi:protein-tyrosine phosphatase